MIRVILHTSHETASTICSDFLERYSVSKEHNSVIINGGDGDVFRIIDSVRLLHECEVGIRSGHFAGLGLIYDSLNPKADDHPVILPFVFHEFKGKEYSIKDQKDYLQTALNYARCLKYDSLVVRDRIISWIEAIHEIYSLFWNISKRAKDSQIESLCRQYFITNLNSIRYKREEYLNKLESEILTKYQIK